MKWEIKVSERVQNKSIGFLTVVVMPAVVLIEFAGPRGALAPSRVNCEIPHARRLGAEPYLYVGARSATEYRNDEFTTFREGMRGGAARRRLVNNIIGK